MTQTFRLSRKETGSCKTGLTCDIPTRNFLIYLKKKHSREWKSNSQGQDFIGTYVSFSEFLKTQMTLHLLLINGFTAERLK